LSPPRINAQHGRISSTENTVRSINLYPGVCMQKYVYSVLAVLIAMALALHAADGDLDVTFGIGGEVSTAFLGGNDYAFALALQSDGRIVAAGSTSPVNGPPSGFALARYNPDGSLDNGFGSGGKVITAYSTGASAVAIQPDAKIVVAGGSLLVRYNTDGSLDPTFGSGGKVIQPGFGGFSISLLLQADGKIVAVGTIFTPGDFALVRYNSDGSLDPGFGSGGIVTTDFSGRDDEAYASALQSDGKIIAAGRTTTPESLGFFALARYNTDGSLDPTFGMDGVLTTSFLPNDSSFAETIVIQPDGKIVAGGGNFVVEDGLMFARYNSDGSLDPTFGTGGKIRDTGGIEIKSLALQPDGKLIAASYLFVADVALARFNSDGSLDSTFGVGGYVSGDGAYSVILQPDGKIVTAGQTDAIPGDFALIRYQNRGRRSPRQITSS
jgi:uncharacterized delta-60 repeat protein